MKVGKKKTLEEHLIEKVKESGYPLEIEISKLLDKDYIVFNTEYYFDAETKQDRDIDIYAIPDINTEVFTNDDLAKRMSPFYLRTEITVECKKSETNAWMFFTRPLLHPTSLHTSGQYLDELSQTGIASSVDSFLFDRIVLHYDDFDEAAIAYDEIDVRKDKSKSRRTIFEGINQLVKFILYEKGAPKEPRPTEKGFSILMFFPIIVFDGRMYKVNLESGEPKPENTKHILIKTHRRSFYTQEVEGFLVDIVHRSYFSDFMNKLHQDFINMRDAIMKHHDELLKKVEKTRQEYESYRKMK